MSDLVRVMNERTRTRRAVTALWSGMVAAGMYVNVHLASAVGGEYITDVASVFHSLKPSSGPLIFILLSIASLIGLFALVVCCHRIVQPYMFDEEDDVTNDRRFPSWNMVDSLSRQLGIPAPMIVHDRLSKVFAGAFRFHGFGKIILSREFLRDADYDEMEAVIAHELSHIYRNDTLTGAVNALGAALSVGACIWTAVGAAVGLIAQVPDLDVGLLAAMASATGLSILLAFGAVASFFAALRSQEYTADLDAVTMTGQPEVLAIYLEHLALYTPLRATSLFSTHPSVEKRMSALMKWINPLPGELAGQAR